jgi:hypothetical protein
MVIMARAILPVKSPEADMGLVGSVSRFVYTRINAKSLPPDLPGNKKMVAEENFSHRVNPKSDR